MCEITKREDSLKTGVWAAACTPQFQATPPYFMTNPIIPQLQG
jgi:hypothetical protein